MADEIYEEGFDAGVNAARAQGAGMRCSMCAQIIHDRVWVRLRSRDGETLYDLHYECANRANAVAQSIAEQHLLHPSALSRMPMRRE